MGRHGEGHLYKKRGRGCWRVRWTFDGTTHDESTGTEDIEKARKVAHQKTGCHNALGDVRALTARLEKARDEQALLEAKSNPSLNLFRLVDAFCSCDLVRRKKNSEATMRTWVSFGNRLVEKFGGATELRSLTREGVEGFMRELEGKVGAAYFNHALQFYKRAWKVLTIYDSPTELKARLPDKCPWEFVLPMKVLGNVGKRPFTPDQLTRIWRVLENKGDDELTILFDLAKNTGARLHDLVSWKWDANVKFTTTDRRFEAVVDFTPIKTARTSGKSLSVPIVDERVVAKLWERRNSRAQGEEFVLPRMHRLYDETRGCAITDLCNKVFKEAGLETTTKVEGNRRRNTIYGLHSFRHTLVTELFDSGVDLGTIQHCYVGHGSALVTELYSHAGIDKKRRDLSNLSRIETGATVGSGIVEGDVDALDEIERMDAPKPVKIYLRGLLQFKSTMELEAVKKWLDTRLAKLKSAPAPEGTNQ